MRLFNVFLFVFILIRSPFAQKIPDQELSWIKTNNCIPKEMCTEIFLKVEKDPIIFEFTTDQFYKLIEKTILNLNLDTDQNGSLKLKILFQVNDNLCLHEIGFNSIHLNKVQQHKLYSELNSISKIDYGKQRDRYVDCQGILYLEIKSGKLYALQNVNFEFG